MPAAAWFLIVQGAALVEPDRVRISTLVLLLLDWRRAALCSWPSAGRAPAPRPRAAVLWFEAIEQSSLSVTGMSAYQNPP